MKKISIIFCVSLVVFLLFFLSLIFLFPKKNLDVIQSASVKYNLPQYLIASVINIESGFDENSVSDMGAIGLMQLLPGTAEDCARRMNINYTKKDLFDVKKNIDIGCYYLSYLFEMFDNNLTNVLCAYNWGLGNVKDWMELGNIDENGTITNIPVKETRNYLRKFKVNKYVYEYIYNI